MSKITCQWCGGPGLHLYGHAPDGSGLPRPSPAESSSDGWETEMDRADVDTWAPSAGQLDLTGNVVESGPLPGPPTGRPQSPAQQLALPVTVPTAYHSQAWGGTVEQAPLQMEGD